MSSENENYLIEFLAILYSTVRWDKIRTSKNPHDIFNHRVRAAARRGDIYAFASKLCNYFGLQSLPVEAVTYLDAMRESEAEVLNTLSIEHIPLCVKAIMLAKSKKKKVEKVEKVEDTKTLVTEETNVNLFVEQNIGVNND